ncbi:hypothetical protein HanRHA438_Chr16g0744221 [Helianthus annuus]|nr:hypothetical protein HanRHA438_Chr16g0744221 [Helianthus annuus]
MCTCPRVPHPHRLLYLSGDSNASGSPLLNRLDENKFTFTPDCLMKIGLANDFLRRDELPPPPPLPPPSVGSDNGRKLPLRRRKNGDFNRNEKTLFFVRELNGDGRLLQKLPPPPRRYPYLHGDAVAGSITSLSDPKFRSNPNEYDRFRRKSRRLNRSSDRFLIGDSDTSCVISPIAVDVAAVVLVLVALPP